MRLSTFSALRRDLEQPLYLSSVHLPPYCLYFSFCTSSSALTPYISSVHLPPLWLHISLLYIFLRSDSISLFCTSSSAWPLYHYSPLLVDFDRFRPGDGPPATQEYFNSEIISFQPLNKIKSLDFAKFLWKQQNAPLSSYWLTHFSNLQITHLKSGRQSLAAFQKSLVKSGECASQSEEKGLKFKRIGYIRALSSNEFWKFKSF